MTSTAGRCVALGCLVLVAILMMVSWAPHRPRQAAANAASSALDAQATETATAALQAPSGIDSSSQAIPRASAKRAPVPPRTEWRRHFGEFEVSVGGDTLEDHLSRVREVLIERHGADQSEEFFELYGRFANYGLALEQDVADPQADPFDPAEGLAAVTHQRLLAHEMLGADAANQLVEPDLARREYLLRRELLLSDPQLSAEAKNEGLQSLGPAPVHAAPIAHNRLDDYHEALKIHARELEQSTDDEGARLRARLRRKIFGDTLTAQASP